VRFQLYLECHGSLTSCICSAYRQGAGTAGSLSRQVALSRARFMNDGLDLVCCLWFPCTCPDEPLTLASTFPILSIDNLFITSLEGGEWERALKALSGFVLRAAATGRAGGRTARPVLKAQSVGAQGLPRLEHEHVGAFLLCRPSVRLSAPVWRMLAMLVITRHGR
jgi:hypothetical protein